MHLSLFSDYSLRILMFAAVKNAEFRVDEVTEAYGISRHHVAKVIHHLGKLGYLETRRGRGGGIQLAQPPEEIRIGKLVRATEGAPVIVECFDPATNTCRISPVCRLKGVLAEAMDAFYESLDRFTLADLMIGPPRNPLRRLLLGASKYPPASGVSGRFSPVLEWVRAAWRLCRLCVNNLYFRGGSGYTAPRF